MRKKKNKGKKTLTAVGAVVAASLTPGIVAATPPGLPIQSPNAAITAAEAIAINGNTYNFDELFAMQQLGDGRSYYAATGGQPQHATRYGGPCKPQATYYGAPRPYPKIVTVQKEKASDAFLDSIQEDLIEYCIQLVDADPYTQGVLFSLDSDLTREIGMSEEQLKALKAEIEDRFGVEVSYHRFYLLNQLNTLRLISEYIFKIKTLWD